MVTTRSMEAEHQEGVSTEDLSIQVAVLQKQMAVMMDMISNLAMTKEKSEPEKVRGEPNTRSRTTSNQRQEAELVMGEEEDEEDEPTSNPHLQILDKTEIPFKVEARIDIPSYDGTIDASQLDSWLDQLETYFSIYGYSSQEKVSFARLKLTHHALVWWNAHLRHGHQNLSWSQFKKLIRQEFYPMGHEEDRWTEWHSLRQSQGQSVQDFTTDFRRRSLTMGISLEETSTITKYVAGLHIYISNELRLFPVHTFSQASGMAMAIERKNQGNMLSTFQKGKQESNEISIMKKNNQWKDKNSAQPSMSSSKNKNNGLYCDHCKLSNHSKDRCWKLHPELFPEKFKKPGDKGKRVAVAVESDQEGRTLTTLNEADSSLSLMVGSNRVPIRVRDPREELFTLRVQVKQELVDAIIDPGSITNLISADLVNRLGLETIAHPRPHKLEWIQQATGVRVDQQCRLRFAISREYIDEVVCDVVPLEICQVLLGSPYLWDRDAIFFRRAQQYRLTKDGVNFIVNKGNLSHTGNEAVTGQVSRTIHACRHVLLANYQHKEEESTGRTVQLFNQSSKTNNQQKSLLEEETVKQRSSGKQENLQKPEGCHDGQSKVSKSLAQKKKKSVCIDGRLKTVAELKKTKSVCTDGRLKKASKKKQSSLVCIDDRLREKQNICPRGSTVVVNPKRAEKQRYPSTLRVEWKKKNTSST